GAGEHRGRDVRLLQADLGLVAAGGLAAGADDLVQRRDGDELALQDVRAALGLAQLVLSAAADDLAAVAQVLLEHALEAEDLRPAVDQGQQDDAGGRLQGGELVELVEDQVGVGAALEVEDQADGLAVAGAGLVAQLADVLDALLLDQVGDGLGEALAGLLEGDLADDDGGVAALLDDVGAGAQGDLPPAGRVAVAHAR